MTDKLALSKDTDELANLARILGAGVNADVMRELLRARRRGEGWMYLTELASEIKASGGSVSSAIAKLGPFVEEKRDKGLRYVRARFVEVRLELERPRGGATLPTPEVKRAG